MALKVDPLFYAALLFSFLFLNSCKEKEGCTNPGAANYDPEAERDDGSCIVGNFVLDFKALVNGVPLVMKDSVYKNVLDYNYKIETLRFYVSNVYLIKSDNSEVPVNDVSYLDFENHHAAYSDEGEKIIGSALPGNYRGIKFAIGVDSSVNNSDPSDYPNDHPLSIYRNAHWTWNTGYIFLKFEGKMDSIPNGNKSLTQLFVYHCGTNPLYREISLSKDFTIAEGAAYQYDVAVNVEKIFYSATDTLDVRNEPVSHTAGSSELLLSERVINLFVNAIENRP